MFFIPKLDIRDYASWVEPAEYVCISANQLPKNHYALKKDYFKDKKIILSSIFRYDSFQTYHYYVSFIKDFTNILPMTADNNLFFNDDASIAAREVSLQTLENNQLFRSYPEQKFIGILKGLTKEDYINNKNHIQDHCEAYIFYVTGFIKSNPRKFQLQNIVGPLLDSIDKPLFLYGCNPKSFNYVKELEKSFGPIGIITESYKILATHSGNFRYKRSTRIQKAWEKLLMN